MWSKQVRDSGKQNGTGCRFLNLNAGATSPLHICEATEEHEWNVTLFEPLAHRRTLAIPENMVHYSSGKVSVFYHHRGILNGPADTNTGASRLKRVLNLQ